MTMTLCRRCGGKVSDQWAQCPACGRKLGAATRTPARRKASSPWIMVAMLASTLVAVAGGFIFGLAIWNRAPVPFWQPLAVPLMLVGAAGYVAARIWQAWERRSRK